MLNQQEVGRNKQDANLTLQSLDPSHIPKIMMPRPNPSSSRPIRLYTTHSSHLAKNQNIRAEISSFLEEEEEEEDPPLLVLPSDPQAPSANQLSFRPTQLQVPQPTEDLFLAAESEQPPAQQQTEVSVVLREQSHLFEQVFPDRMVNASILFDIQQATDSDKPFVRLNKQDQAQQAKDVDFELRDLQANLLEQNVKLDFERVADFVYQIQLPPKTGWNGTKEKKVKCKLAVSGMQLVVRAGGGYQSFLDFLHRKGVLNWLIIY